MSLQICAVFGHIAYTRSQSHNTHEVAYPLVLQYIHRITHHHQRTVALAEQITLLYALILMERAVVAAVKGNHAYLRMEIPEIRVVEVTLLFKVHFRLTLEPFIRERALVCLVYGLLYGIHAAPLGLAFGHL